MIIRKMVERNAFLANPKHEFYASQRAEYDCSANNRRNEDFYEFPSLSHFINEL